ncbi:uncharacterized protein LOC132637636 [Lycium barbarum]|uniref:uncharacterized protein LOC132637636 n=1 Tax=Lycium barbarum TaxID=112863 RepID=UPI00293F3BF7|nr:uncharacterized protein LOC132637636 [Lycium barbarum]
MVFSCLITELCGRALVPSLLEIDQTTRAAHVGDWRLIKKGDEDDDGIQKLGDDDETQFELSSSHSEHGAAPEQTIPVAASTDTIASTTAASATATDSVPVNVEATTTTTYATTADASSMPVDATVSATAMPPPPLAATPMTSASAIASSVPP